MTTTRLIVEGMHCVSCSLLIEEKLEDIGVAATVHYVKQCVDVSYDEKKVPWSTIVETIEKQGYRVVNPVT